MENHRVIAGLNFLNMGRGNEIQKEEGLAFLGAGELFFFFHCNKRKAENVAFAIDKLIKLVVGS